MGKYNFDAIADIDLVELATSMGYTVKKCGSVYKMSCPKANGGDSDPSLVIKTKNNRFNCYHCAGDFRGDAVDFVMGALDCSREEALQYLAKRYPFIVNPTADDPTADQSPEAQVARAMYSITELHKRDQEKYNRELIRNKDVLRAIQDGRQLSVETIGHFGMGVATWGQFPRLTIPNYDAKGRILSYTTRKLVKDDPKAPYLAKNIYIKPKPESPYYDRVDEDYEGTDKLAVYEKHAWFFHVYEAVASGMTIFIVEGHLDVAALYELGQHGGIAIGTNLIDACQCRQLAALLRHADYKGPLVFVPDNDDPGRKTFLDNYYLLREYFPDTVIGYLDVTTVVTGVKDMGDVLKSCAGENGFSREDIDLSFKKALELMRPIETKISQDMYYNNPSIVAMAKINHLLEVATEPFGRAAIFDTARSLSGFDPSTIACAFGGRVEGT